MVSAWLCPSGKRKDAAWDPSNCGPWTSSNTVWKVAGNVEISSPTSDLLNQCI